MNIWFRVDSSRQIGTGHLVRCLTLATALRERGGHSTFVSRAHEGHLIDRIRRSGFDVVELPSQAESGPSEPPDAETLHHASWLGACWKTDARQTREAIADASVDWLVVDHYAIDHRWERMLRPASARIMVIDDLADRRHDCDLLLDQNLVADFEGRYTALVPASCGQLLGPHFAILQGAYAELRGRTRIRSGAVARVLVYFGGVDTDLTGIVVSAFLSLQRHDVTLDVVVSPNHPHLASLQSAVGGHDNIVLHEELPSLAALLAAADLAIGAGGTTTWERCCLGLPSIVITLAVNQEPIASELHRRGLINWLGRKEQVDCNVVARELGLVLDSGLSPEWSTRCRDQVDGLGLVRVCDHLMLSSATVIKARLANLTDETLLLDWANDVTTRRNAFSTAQIDPIAHHAWFSARLADPRRCRLYILETERGLSIGQVRFQHGSDAWELHYSIDQRARGRGVARVVLTAAIGALQEYLDGPVRLIARVRIDNSISSAVLVGLGFRAVSRTDQLIEYELNA